MPEPKRPLKVFLCHAHADRDPVRGLYSRLTQDGVDAWLDKAKLLPGQDWELEIRKAVREANVVVVCLSKQFNQAGFRQREVRLALDTAMEKPEGEIFIIPARLEECDTLESLRKWHWVDLFEDDGYEMLIRALRARANNIGATLQIKKGWLPKITSPIEITTKTPQLVEKPQKRKQPAPKPNRDFQLPKNFNRNLVWILGFVVLVIASIFGLPSLFDTPVDEPTVTQTKRTVALETQTPKPSSTPLIPTSTKTPSYAATPTPLPAKITDAKSVVMALVPEGLFTMGVDPVLACQDRLNNSSKEYCEGLYQDNNPVRDVFVKYFYIDIYEVTNIEFQNCISENQCEYPVDTKIGEVSYFGNTKYNNYPVVWVRREHAEQYCKWREARLPTSAEWEKAARGTDGRIYPWGNEGDRDLMANGPRADDGFQFTAPVGSFPLGASPYGAFDMSGNVNEWVAENITYTYNNKTYTYPLYRGGGWTYGDPTTYIIGGWLQGSDIGFRCAKDVP